MDRKHTHKDALFTHNIRTALDHDLRTHFCNATENFVTAHAECNTHRPPAARAIWKSVFTPQIRFVSPSERAHTQSHTHTRVGKSPHTRPSACPIGRRLGEGLSCQMELNVRVAVERAPESLHCAYKHTHTAICECVCVCEMGHT